MILLLNTCLATTYHYTYELLDKPDGSKNYLLEVTVNEILYENYTKRNHLLYNYDWSVFVTPDVVKPIADDLWTIYDNEEDFANGVLMLVHQIPYVESDPQKFPVETIIENEGDCDILTVLAASILKAGKLDVVLLFLEAQDHMLLGVNLPERPKEARSQVYFLRYEEKKYYIAETTGGTWEKGWRVGECPEILQKSFAKVLLLTNYERSSPGQVSSKLHTSNSSSFSPSVSTNFVDTKNDIEIKLTISPSFTIEPSELVMVGVILIILLLILFVINMKTNEKTSENQKSFNLWD
jgi:hypothetical protein